MTPLLLLLVTPALAHSPHTVVTAMVIPDDFATRGVAWLVYQPGPISNLLISEDFGAHWDFVGGPLTVDTLIAGGSDGNTVVFMGQEGNLWISENGEAWTATALPGASGLTDLVVHNGGFLASGQNGLWIGDLSDPAAAVQLETGDSFVEVAADPEMGLDYAAAIRDDGAVLIADGDRYSFRVTGEPVAASTSEVTFAGGQMYTGSGSAVDRWDGAGWVECGPIPATSGGSHEHALSELSASADGMLLAATGEQAIFVSADACESWTYLDSGPRMTPPYGDIGAAQTPNDAFSMLYVSNSTIIAAGFNGLAYSGDAGIVWSYPKLSPADYARKISMSESAKEPRRVLLPEYGGAACWTNDGGETWSGSAHGIEKVYGYDIDDAGGGVVLYSGLVPYRSVDGGQTFLQLSVDMDRTRVFEVFSDLILALGENVDGSVYGQVAVSYDQGATFEVKPGFSDFVGSTAPSWSDVAEVNGVHTWLVTTDGPPQVVASTDEGETWSLLYQSNTEEPFSLSAGVETWPAGAATRIVHANEIDGVVYSDDAGKTWTPAAVQPTSAPDALESTDDGTLFVGTGDGLIFRSLDGAETWTLVASNIPSYILDFDSAPGFASHHSIVAGTSVGAYFSDDGGENWALLRRYERFESGTFHLECASASGGPCAAVNAPEWSGGGTYALMAGDTVSFSFRGDQFVIDGAADGDGGAAISVDGGAASEWIADGNPLHVEDLGEGWHDVTLTVIAPGPSGFRVDAVETYGVGEIMGEPTEDTAADTAADTGSDSGDADDSADDTGQAPNPDCGCEGDAGFAFPAAMLLLARRRRA